MLDISNKVRIPESNVTIQAIRAQGPGGQNVNKVASAVHLRFDIRASDLPEFYKERLLAMSDHRITRDGVIIIKAQTFRSREKKSGRRHGPPDGADPVGRQAQEETQGHTAVPGRQEAADGF